MSKEGRVEEEGSRGVYLGRMKAFDPRAVACLIVLAGVPAPAQTFKERSDEMARAGDRMGLLPVLQEWRAADPNDAELYVAFFNYYVNESRSSVVQLGQDPGDKEALVIMDPDTSKKEPVGYIYDATLYDPKVLALGFAYADTGISKFPQRLDIRFGKIFMHGENADYTHFTDEIIRAIDHGAATGHAWTWTNNEPVEDGKDFFYGNVQTYLYQLFNVGDDGLFVEMARIARAVLKHEPDNVESMTTLASIHVMNEEYDEGLKMLLRAEQLAPTDDIVTSNIAQAYKRKGDTANAIKYYERTLELGNEETKEFAREQLKELGK